MQVRLPPWRVILKCATAQRLLCLALVGGLLIAAAPAHARGGKKAPPTPSKAALTLLEKQGFAVERNMPTGLSDVYRFPKAAVFVTPDAGLATYLVLLRRVVMHLGGGWDEQAKEHVLAWQKALSTKDMDLGAAFLINLLAGLYAEEPTGNVESEIARLRAGDNATPFPHLGTTLARSPAQMWVGDYLGGANRWQVLVYLLTRVRFPDSRTGRQARSAVQLSMPKPLVEAVRRYVSWVGAARATFPGQRAVFDLEVVGDRRLPPGTLERHAELPAFLTGAGLGNAAARRRIEALAPGITIAPAAQGVDRGTLRAQLDNVLRVLAAKPEAMPGLFKHGTWEALELQTILGVNVQFDKAVGVATGPWDVFGATDLPGFVHPHPAFWRALADLAAATAEKARTLGVVDHEVPTLAEIDRIEGVIEARLKAVQPFSAGELHLLIRCGVGHWKIFWFQAFAGKEYLDKSEAERKEWKDYIREYLDGGQPSFEYARKAAKARTVPAAVPRLERLGELADTMAAIADKELRGEVAPQLKHQLFVFGSLVHRVFSGFGETDPLCVCVPRLRDGPAILFQGCAGMDTLWVRYPWKDGHVDCRGAVFAYRELTSRTWVADAAWRERVRGKEPLQRPSWTSAFVAR